MLDAIVLHNVSNDMFFAYRPETSKLFHAHTFHVRPNPSITETLDLIWTITNIDPDLLGEYADQAEAYRARKNRSLSVGDVIVLMNGEELIYAGLVASMGFTQLNSVPSFHGMTDLNNALPESHARAALVEYAEKVNR